MKLNMALLTTLAVGAIAPTAVYAQQPPDYYVGAGVRTGFSDSTSFVIDSKAKLLEIADGATLSVRPSVLFDSDTELRLPLSVDLGFTERFYPYAGAGIAYNANGSSRVDALVTGGVDIDVARNLVLDLNLSLLFKPDNTDTEFTTTINYAF